VRLLLRLRDGIGENGFVGHRRLGLRGARLGRLNGLVVRGRRLLVDRGVWLCVRRLHRRIAGHSRLRRGSISGGGSGSGSGSGGDYVLVTVTDTGAGMTPEVLARALDPFFTTKEPGKGTGLGLAQAYAFATQSQGSLGLSSVPGQGTRVELHLPRSTMPLSPQPGHSGQAPGPHASGRVLFVEDDALVREAVVRGLEEAGFEVLAAANGDRALAMIEGGLEVDVVFSDIVMPGKLSGIDLAGVLRERRPKLPVVLATGYTDQRAIVPGVQVLAKPYEISQLAVLLSNLANHP
jgi:CheY-like chemotaxis protein